MTQDLQEPRLRTRLQKTLDIFFTTNFHLFFRKYQIYNYGFEISQSNNFETLSCQKNQVCKLALEELGGS